MENNLFITLLWILWIVAFVVQLVVAVKFFSMASDIKAMKDMMQQFMRTKQSESGATPTEDSQLPVATPKRFRWQMWMYIVIAVILLLLFLLN